MAAMAKLQYPPKPRKSQEVLETLKWYWSEVQANRGASWPEITLDFIAATNLRYLAVARKKGVTLAFAKKPGILFSKGKRPDLPLLDWQSHFSWALGYP